LVTVPAGGSQRPPTIESCAGPRSSSLR
jgi:hypothetical protein